MALIDIAFDAKTQGTAGTGSPQTYSHTCTGNYRILYVSIFTVATADTVTSVTYGGVTMTRAGYTNYTTGGGSAFLYRLVNPASGANNVVITYNGSQTYAASVAHSYTGARQTGGTFVANTATTNGATSLTVTLTPNSSNNWIVMATASNGAAPTAGDAAYLRQVGSNVAITAFDTNGGVSGSTNMTANLSSSNAFCSVAESFEPIGYVGRVLVVGQGGGGGASAYGNYGAGGGGAGGAVYDAAYTVTAQAYTVTVGSTGGAGGVPNGAAATNGQSSVFGSLTGTGGGAGGEGNTGGGANGGCGGGGTRPGGTGGTGSQGYNGGNGAGAANYGAGGGGGMGAAGTNAGTNGGNGGAGIADASVGSLLSLTSSGVSNVIAGGGAGSTDLSYGGTGGTAGSGGGGGVTAGVGQAGTANTGSGGGGTAVSGNGSNGGAGGTGLVILVYTTADFSYSYSGTSTTGTSGSETWIKMTTDGNLTLSAPVTGTSKFFQLF